MASSILSVSPYLAALFIALYLNYRVFDSIRSLIMLLSDSFFVMVKELGAVKTALVELQKERVEDVHAKGLRKPKDYEASK